MDRLGVSLGDEVRALGVDGRERPLRVVGEAVFPVIADNAYDATAGLTLHGAERLVAISPRYRHLLRFAPGADDDAVLEALSDFGTGNGPIAPTEVVNLRSVDGYPALVASGFALLAIAGIGQALSLGVRGRRRELTVLRAIGFTPGQVRATVRWWSSAVTAISLVLGLVAGTVVGAAGWSLLAERLGIADDPSRPLALFGLVAVGSGVVALAAALWPARLLTQVPASILRGE